ncbi:MAG: TRAP transporter small permease subunit [Pseudomonadota bacterium]
MPDNIFTAIDRITGTLNRLFIGIASFMMAGLMMIVCTDLALRYFFNAPLIWATEVTEILLLYITFLGAAQVFREDSHVVIDILLVISNVRIRRILGILSNTLVGIVSVVLIYYGFIATYDHFVRNIFNPTILETPIALIIVIIPIGCIPVLLEVLLKSRTPSARKGGP